jgi:hypothetical protein
MGALTVTRRPPKELPPDLPDDEYYRRLEVGFSTLRDHCSGLDPNIVDAELAGRYAALFELWNLGDTTSPSDGGSPPKLRKLTAGEIAKRCSRMLIEVATDRRDVMGEDAAPPRPIN